MAPIESAPLEESLALPPGFYLGADMLAQDQARVLAQGWQYVAHRDELSGKGDHVVTQIAETPVLVVRGADDVLRAFPNVCRHRAGPLALTSGRGAKRLRCRYHGWSYRLDGCLHSAPQMQGATGFGVDAIRLPPLAVVEWLGLVFVTLAAEPAPFEAVVSGIAERIAPVDFSALRHVHSREYEVPCNWKVYLDNYVEGYHLPCVHPTLAQVLDYRAYITELADWYSLQHSPIIGADGVYGEGQAYYYFIYPNTMLNIMPGRLQINRVVPLAPDRCRVDFHYYYAQHPEAQARAAADLDFSDLVQREDATICESVQRGLASGAYEAGRLCPRHEAGVWHFHRLLRSAYAGLKELPT